SCGCARFYVASGATTRASSFLGPRRNRFAPLSKSTSIYCPLAQMSRVAARALEQGRGLVVRAARDEQARQMEAGAGVVRVVGEDGAEVGLGVGERAGRLGRDGLVEALAGGRGVEQRERRLG